MDEFTRLKVNKMSEFETIIKTMKETKESVSQKKLKVNTHSKEAEKLKNQLNKVVEAIKAAEKKLENEKLKKEIKGSKHENVLKKKKEIHHKLICNYNKHDLKFTSEMDKYCNELYSFINEVIKILNILIKTY